MPDCIMFSERSQIEHLFLPRNLQSEVIAMKEMLIMKLHNYIDKLDENQLHIAIGFFKTLFGFDD